MGIVVVMVGTVRVVVVIMVHIVMVSKVAYVG
jgi:hypothetical protein